MNIENRISFDCLQMIVDYLPYKDQAMSRRLCKFFKRINDNFIAEHPFAFPNLSVVVLSKRALASNPNLHIFDVPFGSNNRNGLLMLYASPLVHIIQNYVNTIILYERKEIDRLQNVRWMGSTSKTAYVWQLASKRMIPIDLETGKPRKFLELEISTDKFLKLEGERARNELDEVYRVFEYGKFWLFENLELYSVYSHLGSQSAHYFKLCDTKIRLLQSTDLAFERGSELVLCEEERDKVRNQVLYIEDFYALTLGGGIKKEKIHKTKSKSINVAPASAVCKVTSKGKSRYLEVFSWTLNGRRTHWRQELIAIKGQDKHKPFYHFVDDGQFVCVVSKASEPEVKLQNLELFEKRTGKAIHTHLGVGLLNLWSVYLKNGQLIACDEENRFAVWDIKAGMVRIATFTPPMPAEALHVCHSRTPVAFLPNHEIQVLSSCLRKGNGSNWGQLACYQPPKVESSSGQASNQNHRSAETGEPNSKRQKNSHQSQASNN